MNQPKFSWRWKGAALIVGVLIGASAVLAYQQGMSDNEAKRAVRASIENDRKIEAARLERVRQINHVNQAQCASLANLYSIIRLTLQQSDKSIDQITYYRTHPLERRRAHMQNALTLAKFRTPPCPADITLPNKPILKQ